MLPKSYVLQKKSDGYSNSTSLDVIKSYFKKYYNIKNFKDSLSGSTISKVNETKQTWRSNLMTGNFFMMDTLIHMNIMPSFPLMAITKYNEVILKSFDELKKEKAKVNFTYKSNPPSGYYKYSNMFHPQSYKYTSDYFSGFGKLIMQDIENSGTYSCIYTQRDIALAASKGTDIAQGEAGAIVSTGLVNTVNTHDKYVEAAIHNSSKLLQLSSILGKLKLIGYQNNFYPTMLVNVETQEQDSANNGLYIIDTIEYSFYQGDSAIETTLYVTRDNYNHVENGNPTNKKENLNISKLTIGKVASGCRNCRTIIAFLHGLLNGDEKAQICNYLTSIKYNMLTNFNIEGQTINLNSKLEAVNSMKLAGNAIINAIISRIIPAPYDELLKNIALNPSMMGNFWQIIVQFIPEDYRDALYEFIGLIQDIESLLKEIFDENSKIVTAQLVSEEYYDKYKISVDENSDGNITVNIGENMDTDNINQEIQDITTTMENNTSGADLPFPILDLTDSEKLLDKDQLTDLIADKVVEELTDKGYLEGIDNMKDILLGNDPMDFNTIDKINENVGTILYSRFWGAFTDLTQLTDFYILNGFKDKYKSVWTTKLVDATGGKRLYFAVPQKEKNLKFFINSSRVMLDNVETQLGFYDIYGNPIIYNIYYTDTKYNSNSVLFECRRV